MFGVIGDKTYVVVELRHVDDEGGILFCVSH